MPIYVSWRGLNGVQGQLQHAFNQPSEIREHVKEENTSPTSSSAQAICSMTPLFCGLRIYILYTYIYICTHGGTSVSELRVKASAAGVTMKQPKCIGEGCTTCSCPNLPYSCHVSMVMLRHIHKSKLQGLTPLPVARVRSLGNVLTALKRTRLMGSQSGVQILSICSTYTYPSECID